VFLITIILAVAVAVAELELQVPLEDLVDQVLVLQVFLDLLVPRHLQALLLEVLVVLVEVAQVQLQVLAALEGI
jgi:hypothetical protein